LSSIVTTDSSLEPIYSKIGKDNFTESSSEAMERLKSAIVAMQGVAPPQPSIRLHTINSQYPGSVAVLGMSAFYLYSMNA